MTSIRIQRDEGPHATYNARNPRCVEIVGLTSHGSQVPVLRETTIAWQHSDDELVDPSDFVTIQIKPPLKEACVRYRFSFKNSYGPRCNTPPGHQYAYNGNKLSLRGLVIFGHSSLPIPSPPPTVATTTAVATAATVAYQQLPLSSSPPIGDSKLTVIKAEDSDHYSNEESARSALLTPNEGNKWYRDIL